MCTSVPTDVFQQGAQGVETGRGAPSGRGCRNCTVWQALSDGKPRRCSSARCTRSCSSVSTTHLDHLHQRNTLTAPRCHFSLTSPLSFARQVARRRCGNCHQEITRATPRTSLAPIPATQHLAPVSPLSLSTPQSRPDTEGTTIPPTLCNRTRRAWHAQRSDFTAERYSRL